MCLAAAALVAGGCGGDDRPPVRIGVLADCRGVFGALHQPMLASAELPLLLRGARLRGPQPAGGVEGARIGGRPVELVLGCSELGELTVLVEEARRLVELEHVDVVIGPIGDGEGLMMRELARRYPAVAFVVTASGVPEVTRQDPAPNLYRVTPDAAQQAAGLGTYAFQQLGWRRAAVVLDDNPGGWSADTAFTVEFCALGGTIVERVRAPVGAAGLPTALPGLASRNDGVALLVSSFGSAAAVVPAVAAGARDRARQLLAGPGMVLDAELLGALGDTVDGVVGVDPFPSPDRYPPLAQHVQRFAAAFPGVPPELAIAPLVLPYYEAAEVVAQGLEAAHGDPAALARALAAVDADLPAGHLRFDARRQAVRDTHLVRVAVRDGAPTLDPVRDVPAVDQTFGGALGDGAFPGTAAPACRRGTPAPWAASP